jgi:hypothetical protein
LGASSWFERKQINLVVVDAWLVGGALDEIIGLVFGMRKIGGKLDGAVWWSDFGKNISCGNIQVRERRICRYGLY